VILQLRVIQVCVVHDVCFGFFAVAEMQDFGDNFNSASLGTVVNIPPTASF
jgi:hypothetical protein